MPVCTIHIGLPKAGSTSIQAAILSNRARLADSGIFVPETTTSGYHVAHHGLARAFLNAQSDAAAARVVDGMKAEVARAGFPPHILMSSEDFQIGLHRPAYVKRLRDTLAGLGYGLRLVAYVRPQVAYVNSAYSQGCKVFIETRSMQAYVAQALGHRRFNYKLLLLPALDVEGIETIYRPFNDDVVRTGIVRDLFTIVGLDEAAIAALPVPPARNVSPGPKMVAACCEIARRLAQAGIVLEQGERGRASRAVASLGEQLGWPETRFSGIDRSMAAHIRRHCAKDNHVFAEKVWGRRWKDVFGADWWVPEPLNVFDREQASAEEAKEFDQVVERAVRLLKDGGVEALAAQARPFTAALPLERWLTQLRASFAGLKTK